MSLHARLKKLEAQHRPVHVVDSREAEAAVRKAIGGPERGPAGFLPPGAGEPPGAEERYPTTYQDLVARGEVIETPAYVASLWTSADEAAAARLDPRVERWRAEARWSPLRAYEVAESLRAILRTPVPEEHGEGRPGFELDDFLQEVSSSPPTISAAKRHPGVKEAAAWADAYEAEHPEEVAAWERERDAQRAECKHKRHESRRRDLQRAGAPYEAEDIDAAREEVGLPVQEEPRTPRSDWFAYQEREEAAKARAAEIAAARGYVLPSPVA